MELLYSREQIDQRIAEMAAEISSDYEGKDILAIGLLKGCTIFMSHLLVQIKGSIEIDFMTISSYKHGSRSENFKFIQDLDTDVADRDVLIVEDIIDTGKTMAFTQQYLKAQGARSVETATFVNKTTRRSHDINPPKYVGFNYNEEPFIVGFGFDYGGKYRNLPAVYQMSPADYHQQESQATPAAVAAS